METNEIINHLLHTPDNTNPKVLKDILAAVNISSENQEKIIQYAMETPHNMNGSILKTLLESSISVRDPNITTFTINGEQYLHVCFIEQVEKDTTIDWGDGTISQSKGNTYSSLTGVSYSRSDHTYETDGEYTIKLINTTGLITFSTYVYEDFTQDTFRTVEQNKPFLNSIQIGKNVASIGKSFINHPNLTSIYVMNPNPPNLNQDAFNGASPDLTIYVPKNSLTTYQNHTDWQRYIDIIVEADF